MKKYLLSIVLVLMFTACLFSCKQEPADEQNDGGITIAYADETAKDFADELAEAFAEKSDCVPKVVDAASAPASGVVIIGNTERGVSKKAYHRFELMDEPSELSAQYAVYSDGVNLAIAYSDKAGYEAAADAVMESYETSGNVISSKGVLAEGYVSYRARAEEAREKMREEILEEVTETHGSEIATALSNFYALFDDDVYIWMANLWDPNVGGFYYSNSARDNVGFLPDIESTAQLLGWLESAGLVDAYDGQWENALPVSMKTKILQFAQSLQDPDDGYFYHPQWSKESTTTSRRGRDNGWALSLISQLGGAPYYPNATTPSEEPDLVSSGNLMQGLGTSAVSAVSKVISTNSLLPSYLQSPDAFEEYIRGLNLHANSYNAGNTLAAQWRDIKAAGPMVIRRMFEVFAELQFPETGMWEDTVSYNAVNGLFKISSLYQHFDEPVPYVDIAVMGVIEVLKNPEGATHVCSVYNPWATLVALKETMSKSEWNAVQKLLYNEAAALINVTREKYLPCLVPAGGFSYYHGKSASTSQGMMVAVPSTCEADVNGTGITLSALKCMTQVLGLGTAKIYCEEDYDYFINTIGSLGEIIKDDEMVAEPITFDDEYIPNNISNTIPKNCEKYIEFKVVDDPRPTEDPDSDLKDMAMSVEVLKQDGQYASSSSNTYVPVMNPFSVGSCYAIEMDFMYESTDATSNLMTQLFFMDSKTSFAIAFNVYSKGNEKKIRIVEHANSGVKDVLATGLDFGEWIHLRVEFYRTENKAIIYVNGKPESIADLYFEGTEERNISRCSLLHYRAVASKLYLDNIIVEKLDKAFVSFGSSGGDVNFGTEEGSAVAKGPTTYEDNCPSADNVKIVKNSPSTNSFISFERTSDAVAEALGANNNALKVETFSGYTDFSVSYINVMNADYSLEADGFDKSYTFEADMYVDPSTAEGWINQMFFYTGTACSYSISFRVIDLGVSGKFVRISRNSTNENRNSIIDEGVIEVGKWFNIKIVFYKGSSEDGSMTAARYFIDGKYCAQDLTYRKAAIENTAPVEYAQMTVYSRDTKILMYMDNISFTEKEEVLPEEPKIEGRPSDGIADFEVGDPDVEYVTNTNNNSSYFSFSTAADPVNVANRCLKVNVSSVNYRVQNDLTKASTTDVKNVKYDENDVGTCTGNAFHFETDVYNLSIHGTTAVKDGIAFKVIMYNSAGGTLCNYSVYIKSSYTGETVNEYVVGIYNNNAKKYVLYAMDDDGYGVGFDEWFKLSFTLYVGESAESGNTGMLIKLTGADGTTYSVFDESIATNYANALFKTNKPVKFTRLQWYNYNSSSATKRVVYLDDIRCMTLKEESYTSGK